MVSVKKIESLKQRIKLIQKELRALSSFRPTKQLEQFRRQLAGEYSYAKRQLDLIQASKKAREAERRERVKKANRNRSEKMKRTWRYLKSIQENYHPNKSLRELRSMFKKHKEGLETEIPDVAWRNPSP